MTTHLAHKLPWGILTDLFLLHPPPDPTIRRPFYINVGEKENKRVEHFARCFASAVKEFQESDRSTEEERFEYDPHNWSTTQREHGIGAWAGFFETLIEGYVTLNLILSDPNKFVPRVCPAHGAQHSDIITLMLGHYDGSHPPEISNHLRQVFDRGVLKPVDAEVMQVLRDHAARLFRCMYSISGVNKFTDAERVAPKIMQAIRLRYYPEDE